MADTSASPKYVRGEMLCEGKTKQIFAVVAERHLALVLNKDRITAHNALTAHNLPGKAECATVTNASVFQYLNDAGVKTSFVSLLDSTSFLARRCTMIPIEWVSRRIATGSFLKRNPGVQEGFRFSPVKIETFYKDDANNDPEWSTAQVLSLPLESLGGKPVTERQHRLMADTTSVVFEVLERAWASIGCTLVDMKVEYGIDQETGEILLSDVIDNDSWRLWEGGQKALMKDKQVYRNLTDFTEDELKKVKLNYDWVRDKLASFKSGPLNTVVLLMGSPSDSSIGDEIKNHCDQLGIQLVRRVMSAHKVTEETLRTVRYYNSLPTPVVFVAVAGRSNGLGPVLAGNTTLPVINCPPFSTKAATHDVWSSLSIPSGLSCCTVLYPEAAALLAASIFAVTDHRLWGRLRGLQLRRQVALDTADHDLQTKDLSEEEQNE